MDEVASDLEHFTDDEMELNNMAQYIVKKKNTKKRESDIKDAEQLVEVKKHIEGRSKVRDTTNTSCGTHGASMAVEATDLGGMAHQRQRWTDEIATHLGKIASEQRYPRRRARTSSRR